MAVLWTLAFLSLIGFSLSQTSDCSYYGLMNHLNLTASNTLLQNSRPVKNWNSSTLVRLDIFLLGILKVDDKSQTVTVHILINMAWKNEFLNWNSSDFCEIKKLTVPRSLLWTPDVKIQEDVSDRSSVQEGPLVTVTSRGLVYLSVRQRLTYTCRLDLMMFPFDTQNCTINFSSFSSEDESIKLGTISSDEVLTKVSEAAMVTKGEWELDSIEIVNFTSTIDRKSKLSYTVTMKRKPMLYVINFIIPLFYFLVLDLASFFINEARGEKLSFKVTLLLSISVLLLILNDMVTSTERNLPMIANYCVGIFTLVGVSVLEAMIVTFLMNLDDHCCMRAQKSKNRQVDIHLEADYHKEAVEVEEKGRVKAEKRNLNSDCELLKQILDEVQAAREEAGGEDKGNDKRAFRTVAEITDRVFFFLYCSGSAFFLLFMYLVWISKVI